MIRNVFRVSYSSKSFNLSLIRDLVKKGLDLNLSTETKTEEEPIVVLSKILNQAKNEQVLLKESKQVLDHFVVSYAIVCDVDDFEQLHSLEARLVVKPCTSCYIIIATATINEWRRNCVLGCSISQSFRWICNQVWDDLLKLYPEVCSSLIKTSNRDGTYKLSWSQQKNF